MKKTLIGFKDKNSKEICLDDNCIIYDSTGKSWCSRIVAVNPKIIASSRIVKNGGIQYAFKSSNMEVWINNQKHASKLEII